MLTATAAQACFVPGTVLPDRRETLAAVNHGQAGRDLMAAVFAGDRPRVERLLQADRQLATTRAGSTGLVKAAIARCDMSMVDRLLALGVPPDGPGGETPLILALRSREPWFAERLLKAGASPDPQKRGGPWPMYEAISLGQPGRVRLLIAYGADIGWTDALGNTALQAAVDMDRFRIAELLLQHGANLWTTDSAGGTIAQGAVQPLLFDDAHEAAAQARLIAHLKSRGWPWPPPDPREVRRRALSGNWPPEAARRSGAQPVPGPVLATMRERFDTDGNPRPPRSGS